MGHTVFILGAGASTEADLPVGEKLKDLISGLLNIKFGEAGVLTSGDDQIVSAFRHVATRCNPPERDVNPYLHAARRVAAGMNLAPSIDNYLDAHRADLRVELAGKLAIVLSILRAERSSKLYSDPQQPGTLLNQSRLKATWFNRFWQAFSENCTAVELEKRAQSVKFIVFNYDRCIEQFLYHATQTYYGLNSDDAARIVRGLTFLHPYGSVGSLPWMQQEDRISYGGEVGIEQLVKSASRIRTFTESSDSHSSNIDEIRRCANGATRIVFLGFAFHRQNLSLLWPSASQGVAEQRIVFGTALNISRFDVEAISSELDTLIGRDWTKQQIRNDLDCYGLFQEYKRGLSFL